MFERFDEIFRSCGWRVVELRYGKRLQGRARRSIRALKAWFEQLPNADLSALHYQGGAAWRTRIEAELGKKAAPFLKEHDDDALAALFTDLGGHCMETLVEAFDAAQDDVPTLFIAWTIKGFGLPFAGHKDNHAGLMNPTQLAALRDSDGRSRGPRMGAARRHRRQCADRRRGADRAQPRSRARSAAAASARVAFPRFPHPPATSNRRKPRSAGSCSTCRKAGGDLADRIVTTSPDVTVSTNLGAWVNQRGLFRRSEMPDVFAKAKIASAQKWAGNNNGQHIELGIAESNLFLMLAAAGPVRRPVRHPAVPDRNALRPVHRPRPR